MGGGSQSRRTDVLDPLAQQIMATAFLMTAILLGAATLLWVLRERR